MGKDAMRYLMIHCVDEKRLDPDEVTPPDLAESLAAWVERMTARGVLLDGSRLQPVSDATTLRVRGGEVLLTDGPFAETREQVAGYDIIECADLDEALEVASQHPTALVGSIEVRPFWTG
jgi:hypothetical protein